MALPNNHPEKVWSDNLYERLGVTPNASTAEIEAAFKERENYWLKIPPHHPKYGKDKDVIRNRIAEARLTLTDPSKRNRYDQELRQQLKETEAQKQQARLDLLIPQIKGVLADGVLTKVEIESVFTEAYALGLPDELVEQTLEKYCEEYFKRTGNEVRFEDEIPGQIPVGEGRPKLVIENLDTRKIVYSQLRLNTKTEREITINNSGGGVNSGTITTTESWLKVSRDQLDTKVHRQSFKIIIDTRNLELFHTYSGKVKIKTLGGSEVIQVDISTEGAKARAKKLSNITTGITAALGFGVAGMTLYPAVAYLSTPFFVVLICIFIGILSFRAILKGNKAGYFWLIVSILVLGFTNILMLALLIPIPIARWISRPFFNKFPTKTSFVGIIPVVLCISLWGGGYFGIQHPDFFINIFKKADHTEKALEETDFEFAVISAPQGASVRSGPGVSHARIAALPNGARVKVIDQNGSWYKIKFNNDEQAGYVYQNLLHVEGQKSASSVGSTKETESDDRQSFQANISEKIYIYFESVPKDARIFLDNKLVGKTPVGIMLLPGDFKLKLKADGYRDFENDLKIEANGQTEFKFEMARVKDVANK